MMERIYESTKMFISYLTLSKRHDSGFEMKKMADFGKTEAQSALSCKNRV